METTIHTLHPIRSQTTGVFLPREGRIVDKREQFGRPMYLVKFERETAYLFDGEFEVSEQGEAA